MMTHIPGAPSFTEYDGNFDVGAVPDVPPCMILAKCALRLKIESLAYHYYGYIGRDCSPTNMNYNTILHNFIVEWEALIN